MNPLDTELFIQNVKTLCYQRGEKVTVVCEKSGAGRNLISNLRKGSMPSVEKVHMLARYLGCSISALLGEGGGAATQVIDERYAPFSDLFASLSPEDQNKVIAEMLRLKTKK